MPGAIDNTCLWCGRTYQSEGRHLRYCKEYHQFDPFGSLSGKRKIDGSKGDRDSPEKAKKTLKVDENLLKSREEEESDTLTVRIITPFAELSTRIRF